MLKVLFDAHNFENFSRYTCSTPDYRNCVFRCTVGYMNIIIIIILIVIFTLAATIQIFESGNEMNTQ